MSPTGTKRTYKPFRWMSAFGEQTGLDGLTETGPGSTILGTEYMLIAAEPLESIVAQEHE
jgi:hypothetical protein